MKREQLLKEIAEIDEEINSTIASTELPDLKIRPFPFGTWVLAALCLGWAKFGDRIPGAFIYHSQTAEYAVYAALFFSLVALLITIIWVVRGRGYHDKSDAYLKASRDARDLQERRRDLQAELRAISKT